MNSGRFRLAVFLTLPLLGLWMWRAHVSARREQDMALFEAYIEGPINDYAFAVTRSLPGIFTSKGGSDLPDAQRSAKRSVDELKALLLSAPPGWIRERLEFVLPLHERMAVMLDTLPKKPDEQKAWLAEEKALRSKIIYTLQDVRYSSFNKWKMSQSRFLELNALIYSLNEAGDAVSP